jgi:hypothetical protein
MMKRLEEFDAADDCQGMVSGRVSVLNLETNKSEYVYVSLSFFSYKVMLFIIVMDFYVMGKPLLHLQNLSLVILR